MNDDDIQGTIFQVALCRQRARATRGVVTVHLSPDGFRRVAAAVGRVLSELDRQASSPAADQTIN